MIDGLTLEYAYARTGARLAQRPDERLWQRLRSARSVPALLEAVRASPAAAAVSGVPPRDADTLELAFRQQLRLRIAEVGDWSPAEWQSALRFTAHLIDLPALLHLLRDEAPPRWIAADPELGRYTAGTRAERRAALADGPLAGIATAVEASDVPANAPRRRVPALHAALTAWETEWRALWPHSDTDSLEELITLVKRHMLRFPGLALDAATAAREELAAQLLALVHRRALQPVALFAGIALHALDLERLRGEFVLRARSNGAAP